MTVNKARCPCCFEKQTALPLGSVRAFRSVGSNTPTAVALLRLSKCRAGLRRTDVAKSATSVYARGQELCESRGGRPGPGLPVPNGPYGLSVWTYSNIELN